MLEGEFISDVTHELQQLWAAEFRDASRALGALGKYFERGVRSAAIGEMSEVLIAHHLGSTQTKRNSEGHDIAVGDRLIEVKSRLMDDWGDDTQFNFSAHTQYAHEAFCLAWSWGQLSVEPILAHVYWLSTNLLAREFGTANQKGYFARTDLRRLKKLGSK